MRMTWSNMKQDVESIIFGAEMGEPLEIGLHEASDVYEGVRALDQFIDQAFVRGEEVVKVIHGRGTGRMRDGIHEALTEHETVVFFRDSHKPEEIGGVTYAVLSQ